MPEKGLTAMYSVYGRFLTGKQFEYYSPAALKILKITYLPVSANVFRGLTLKNESF
jgi:hypothetical protein